VPKHQKGTFGGERFLPENRRRAGADPRTMHFSIIGKGVDAESGELYASFSCSRVSESPFNRRTSAAMIFTATAASCWYAEWNKRIFVKDHGLNIWLAATVLAGLIQIGWAGLPQTLGVTLRLCNQSRRDDRLRERFGYLILHGTTVPEIETWPTLVYPG